MKFLYIIWKYTSLCISQSSVTMYYKIHFQYLRYIKSGRLIRWFHQRLSDSIIDIHKLQVYCQKVNKILQTWSSVSVNVHFKNQNQNLHCSHNEFFFNMVFLSHPATLLVIIVKWTLEIFIPALHSEHASSPVSFSESCGDFLKRFYDL